jgi:glyoxylase-like metal-dependent hydrolase (beta-lactamase superfamily II)
VAVPGYVVNVASKPRVELGVWSFVIRSGELTILFDGGLCSDIGATMGHIKANLGEDFGYTGCDAEGVQLALDGVGVSPADVDIAVVSHLHHDHSGAIEWLPKAKVWLHAEELDVLESPYARMVAPSWQIPRSTISCIAGLAESRRLVAWRGEEVEVCEGVRLMKVGGHTAGSVALLCDVRPDWRVALLGDLLLTEDQLENGVVPTTALDTYATIRSVSRILDSADELWAGHALTGSVLSSDAVSSWPLATEWRIEGV